MIESVNLSITHMCSASCIFCPNDRGECVEDPLMEIPTFQRIIKEAKKNNVKQIIYGENGDAFLHNNFIYFLIETRRQLPEARVVLYTNFLSSNAEQWHEIIRDKLVDHVVCNIDSIRPERYGMTKNADFYLMWENFTGFILMRTVMFRFNDITLEVNVLDPAIYRDTFEMSFPEGMIEDYEIITGEDTTTETISMLKYLIGEKDCVQGILPCFWAERDQLDGYLENNWCPQLNRVKTEAFFSPDGDWYACCLDSKNELKLGNINEHSLVEIAQGEKRQHLIQQLEEGKFTEIGSPCNKVVCCHSYKLGGKKNERRRNTKT